MLRALNTFTWRYFGLISIGHGDGIRFRWLQITGRRLGLALALCLFDDDSGHGEWTLHVHLGWPNIFLRLPLPRTRREPHEGLETWGFSLCRDSYSNLHLNWGRRVKIVHLPWEAEWQRTSYLLKGGRWFHERRGVRLGVGHHHYERVREVRDAAQWRETHPYRYVLRNGDVQDVQATIAVEEREWRPRWLRWCRWAGRVRRTISVEFSGEVGEEAGSWKGGCTGCGYTLLQGEAPVDALRRMERERKF